MLSSIIKFVKFAPTTLSTVISGGKKVACSAYYKLNLVELDANLALEDCVKVKIAAMLMLASGL